MDKRCMDLRSAGVRTPVTTDGVLRNMYSNLSTLLCLSNIVHATYLADSGDVKQPAYYVITKRSD